MDSCTLPPISSYLLMYIWTIARCLQHLLTSNCTSEQLHFASKIFLPLNIHLCSFTFHPSSSYLLMYIWVVAHFGSCNLFSSLTVHLDSCTLLSRSSYLLLVILTVVHCPHSLVALIAELGSCTCPPNSPYLLLDQTLHRVLFGCSLKTRTSRTVTQTPFIKLPITVRQDHTILLQSYTIKVRNK